MSVASFLTDFADQAVLLPMAASVGVVLACSGWRRGALVWTLAVGGALAAMLALKLAFIACGHLVLYGEIQSPSGHTAAAATVYGGLGVLVARWSSHRARVALLAAPAAALAIGASRLALGVHTALEVVVGATVGVAATLALAWLAGRPPPTVRPIVLATVVAAVALFFHGFRLPAEAAIRDSAFVHLWPLSACAAW